MPTENPRACSRAPDRAGWCGSGWYGTPAARKAGDAAPRRRGVLGGTSRVATGHNDADGSDPPAPATEWGSRTGPRSVWVFALGLVLQACGSEPPPPPPAPTSVPKTSGLLRVSSEPEGAMVLLDGEPGCGPTPCAIREVGFGPHVLVFSHPDYEDFERKVRTTEDTTLVKSSLQSEGKPRAPGTVKLVFAKEKASRLKGKVQVTLEGKGEPLPLSDELVVALPSGVRSLSIQRAGYLPLLKKVEVLGGEETELLIAKDDLSEATLTLQIDSSPVKGEVRVDGKEVGVTPVTVSDLAAPRSHKVVIQAEGFEKYSTVVRWREGSYEIPISATLSKAGPTGFLVLRTSPLIGLTVYIDGKKTRHTTPIRSPGIKLSAGKHQVGFASSSGKKFSGGSIEIKEGETLQKAFSVN